MDITFNDQVEIWGDRPLFEEQYKRDLQLAKEGQLETAVLAFATADDLYRLGGRIVAEVLIGLLVGDLLSRIVWLSRSKTVFSFGRFIIGDSGG